MGSPQRILIQTVGTGGAKHPVWEGLAFVQAARQPDLLVNICSAKTHEETLPKLEASIQKTPHQPAESRVITVSDENSFNRVLADVCRVIDELRQKFPNATIEGDFTSGTKAMSAGLATAFVAYDIGPLYYGVGKRDQSGRARITDAVHESDIIQAIAASARSRIGRFLRTGQYDAALGVCILLADSAASSGHETPPDIARARALTEMMQAWDRFQWGDAKNRAPQDSAMAGVKATRTVDQYIADGWQKEEIEGIRTHLAQCACAAKPFSNERAIDLLANVRRRLAEERFDDAMARMYRLLEFIGQARFAMVCQDADANNPTNGVPWEWIDEHAQAWAKSDQAPARTDTPISIGLKATWSVLLECGDEVAAHIEEVYDYPHAVESKLGNLLRVRNDSWLAHGSNPVRSDRAEALHEILTGISQRHIGDQFDTLLQAAQFPKCPWAPATSPTTEDPTP